MSDSPLFSLLDALRQQDARDDSWKQSVISTFESILKRMSSDKVESLEREKTMESKLKTLTTENSELKRRVSTLDLDRAAHEPTSVALRPSLPLPSPPILPKSNGPPINVLVATGGRKKKLSSVNGVVQQRPSDLLRESYGIFGNPFGGSPKRQPHPPPPPCNLNGSTLAILPVELIEHILRYLHLDFHNHDRFNALAGLANPDPYLFPPPWNPVSLQRVNRLFRELAYPLFYAQIAIDSSRPTSLTLLEMNFVASTSAYNGGALGADEDEDFAGLDSGHVDHYEAALKALGINPKGGKKARKSGGGGGGGVESPGGAAAKAPKPVFRPNVKTLVLFIRDERTSGSARSSSAFYSSLQCLEENLADKYAFLRPSREPNPPRRPLSEILSPSSYFPAVPCAFYAHTQLVSSASQIVSTKSWLIPSLDVTAPYLTVVPREISTQVDWYSSSLFSMVERASKPSASQRHLSRSAQNGLSTLRIRLPKAPNASVDPPTQARDLEQLKNHFHKLTYVRTLRIDFAFSVAEEQVASGIEGVLRSPSLLAARHFYDGVRTKVEFGVIDEGQAVVLRKKVEEWEVGEIVEVLVEVNVW